MEHKRAACHFLMSRGTQAVKWPDTNDKRLYRGRNRNSGLFRPSNRHDQNNLRSNRRISVSQTIRLVLLLFGEPHCSVSKIPQAHVFNLIFNVRKIMLSSTPLGSTPFTDQVISAVIHNPHVNLNTMHIETRGDNVTIKGTAQSFFEKQMAQEAIRKIDGVKGIDNCLEVVWN